MNKVDFSLDFIATIHSIAHSPKTEVGRFKQINPIHATCYSFDRLYMVMGLAAAIFSTTIFKHSKLASGILFLASSFTLFKSVNSKEIETVAYSNQITQIKNLFDPCIEGLKKAYLGKANAIYKAISGRNMSSFEKVFESIDLVAAIYDREKDSTQWEGTTIQENEIERASYNALKEDAQRLIDLKLETLSSDVSSIAKDKLKELQKVAYLFLNGKDKNLKTKNYYYVHYGYSEGKALIREPSIYLT